MGLLKNLALLIISLLLLGCTKIILYKNYNTDVNNISVFGNTNERSFFIDKSVNPNLNFEWNSSTYGSYSNTTFSALDSLLIVPDLGGRITAFHIENGKKIGQLKYSGEIEQAVAIKKGRFNFIVNESKKNYSTFVSYDFTKGKELTSIELKGKFNNELISTEKQIIAISDFGNIYSISLSGEITWQIDLEHNVYANPTADEKHIYIATAVGTLISLSLDDGEIIYQFKIAHGIQSGITLEGNTLYLGDDEGNLFSVNKSNGKVNWKFQSNYKIVSTPGLDNRNIYFGNLNGDFYSIEKKSGKLIWMKSLGGLINTSPLIFQNIIIQPNLQKHVDIVDKQGELVQQIEFDGRCRTTPIYFKDRLYFGVDKGEVFCYSFVE